MAKRSLKDMSEERKCCAAGREGEKKSTEPHGRGEKHSKGNWNKLLISDFSADVPTFDVVNDWDYVLVEQLRGAAAELRRLNVLENGAKLCVFLTERVAAERRAEEDKKKDLPEKKVIN